MRISGTNAAQNQQVQKAQTSGQMDSTSKNLINQIKEAQKQLQEISSMENMSSEEKMKKRDELQTRINDLNAQLRQHEMELKNKAQEKNEPIRKENQIDKTQSKHTGMSTSSMKAIISADSAKSQAQVQSSVVTKMEGRAGVLKIEIKTDGNKGFFTKAKQEELADVQKKAQNAISSELDTLMEANEALSEMDKDLDSSSNSVSNKKIEEDKEKEHKDVRLYSEEGKAVEEEQESTISVLV